MTINITGRKTTIKDSFREEAEREMTRFDRLVDDYASAHITVSNEGGRETVEITIRSGGMIFRAEKTIEDRKQSLAQAGDLLFRQIVKNKSKLADRFKKRAPEIYAEPAAEAINQGKSLADIDGPARDALKKILDTVCRLL